jgi:hypothetical protein
MVAEIRRVVFFFDKLEDHIRAYLSRMPIVYAFVGAVGIILVWKGVWEVAEHFTILNGIGSIVLGTAILLSTGLMVSFFIGDTIIISGLKREKKLAEKTEREVHTEEDVLFDVKRKLAALEREVGEIQEKI